MGDQYRGINSDSKLGIEFKHENAIMVTITQNGIKFQAFYLFYKVEITIFQVKISYIFLMIIPISHAGCTCVDLSDENKKLIWCDFPQIAH